MHQPIQHLGRAIGGVADQALGVQAHTRPQITDRVRLV
jgi:hypothetical protein